MSFSIVILAGGQGTRMQSLTAKVLHQIAGKSMIKHIIDTALKLKPEQIILVYGAYAEHLKEALSDEIYKDITWVLQQERKGTGHALLTALPYIDKVNQVLIWYGDVPLMSENTLKQFLKISGPKILGMINIYLNEPKGFGRVLRNNQAEIEAIIEETDANDNQKLIKEVFTGFFIAPFNYLEKWLHALAPKNSQKEYYLTDLVKCANHDNLAIQSIEPDHPWEVQGINTKAQLIQLERTYQKYQAHKLLDAGVTILDPLRFDLRGTLNCGLDVLFDINVIIEGEVSIGNNTSIGANTIIKNSMIGDNITIKPNSIIEGAHIENDCNIGPFSRIRPQSHILPKVSIGNFVEVKNTKVGHKSKINHLSYIGDAIVGEAVNIGAGTITCNYDGVSKHKTIIGNYASIGANSQLIAPVSIGESAVIGAGTTILKNAPAHHVTINTIKTRCFEKKTSKIKINSELDID